MSDIESVVSHNKVNKMSGEESETLENVNTNSVQTIVEKESISSPVSSNETPNNTMDNVNDDKHVAKLSLDSQNITLTLHNETNTCCTTKENHSEQINDLGNEEQLIKTTRKRITLIDSDSENELNQKQDEDDASPMKDSIPKTTSKKRLTLIDSDSEDDRTSTVENIDDIFNENKSTSNQKMKSRLLQLCDSDSEDDTLIENKSVTIFDQTEETVYKEQTFARLKTLCDSDSSAEEMEENTDKIIKQKRNMKNDVPIDKPMTGKEALEQRRQIKSESQKIVRETRIHLPYHRPKQHTLQEFLKRKNLLNTSIKAPPNTPTGMSIKIFNKDYKTTEKTLKEREKEIEEFYKSESEEDEPETAAEQIEEKSTTNSENVMNDAEKSVTNLEDVQKEVQECISSDDTVQLNEAIEKENTSNDTIEKMQTESQEQFQNNEETIINTKELIEAEKNDTQLVNIEINKDTEEKLKELRLILEKNLPKNDMAVEDDTMEIEVMESEINKQSLQVESSQKPEDKEEKKKKLLEIENKLKQLNPLIALKSNYQPRLSGGPNELIVLDDDIEKSKRVNNLMQRFMKHTAKKQTSKTSEVNIVNVEGGIIHKDTITVVQERDDDDEPVKKFQIPGVKMKKLKMELEDQILKQRMEELKKRQEEMKLYDEDNTYVGEKETCGLSNKLLDNEEEEELTDQSSESESEEEEDDIDIKDKPRVKSAFVDEEADESDEEMVDGIEEEDIEDEESETEIAESNVETGPKQLRRIIKPVEDSDDDTSSPPESEIRSTVAVSTELSSQTPHKSSSWEDNDEDIPVYQQPSEKTPCKFATQNRNDLTTFLTPPLHLTALQGMNSATKSLQGSPNVNSYLSPEPSPLKSHLSFKTKLFTDQNEDNLDDLENLCSGKFSTQIETQKENSKDLSTQENELLNICSGNFNTFTQNTSSSIDSLPVKASQNLNEIINDHSQNFKLTIENVETIEKLVAESIENEEENKNNKQTASISKTPKMVIASSSEDEDEKNEVPKKKKIKKKRKYIIDDISISDDEDLEEREEDFEEEEQQKIHYDSEENEIEYEEFEDETNENPARKATDFLENEAELSESDWGSEDEDEKNLDDYEVEEGDAEKINEKKVQRELERMHMRNILDEDQREVKMLQEILLDDGELHGTGRERKFRWKNADSLSWNEEKPKEEEEECEEIESELDWRKMRYEREMFLKEQQAKKQTQPEEEIMNDSQFLKLGQEALKKSIFGSQHFSQNKTPIADAISKTDDIKLPFTLAMKRGSFLHRSETTLARIAEITKVSSNLGGPKNSKNFIFTTVQKTEIIEEQVTTKKRKADEGTPKAFKKIKIADMSPNVGKKKKITMV